MRFIISHIRQTLLVLFVILFIFTGEKPSIAYKIDPISDGLITGKFELAPAMKDFELKEGEHASVTFMVRNLTGKELDLAIYTAHVIGSQNTFNPWLETNEPTWITPEIDRIKLKNLNKLSFNINIEVPKDARQGTILKWFTCRPYRRKRRRKSVSLNPYQDSLL